MPVAWSNAGKRSSRAQSRTVLRTRFPRSEVSQQRSISSTVSQRPATCSPSTGPSSVCAKEYSILFR
jgi:hypothetical protein